MPKKEKVGHVVSNKMEKTIVVAVEEQQPHPKYGKYQRKTTKFKAHDEANACHPGDKVRIVECRPLSREKTWTLKEILERSQDL
ncbi:MAG: 30S ribosomal protein S17 [Vampirovibrionales bacterium]|nr:30S ribosomal protein S17 [Vampirovibrionales bacterium]